MTEYRRPHSDPRIAERAIVLQLLRDDQDVRWSLSELEAEVSEAESSVLSSAVERLERHGVAVALDNWVLASRCAQWLDELGLVAI